MYAIDTVLLIKFFLVIGILLFVSFVFDSVMSKYLKVEKRKAFSYSHVNEKHKKTDWIIRISFIIIILITHFFIISSIKENTRETIWYLETWFLILVFLIISEMVRAFMEWKYAENRKAYIFTISKLIFILILFWIIFSTNFFNSF